MRKWLPLLAVCTGTFMLLVDVTIVNVALPAMVLDLDASFTALQWVVDAYALSLAALVMAVGSIADQVGHRKVFLAGLVVFAVSSLACGVSDGSGVLIAARAVQGVGGAAMFATTFPLLSSSYSGRDRGTAFAMWGAVAGASAAVGPILGGVLTEAISWRWIFFVNLPVSVVVIGLCFALADAPVRGATGVDVPGAVTFTAAAGTAVYGMIRASEHGWSAPGTWGLLAASAALLVTFLVVEARVRHPLLDLALLRNRAFVAMLVAGLFLSFAAFGALIYTSIWLQSVLGLSPIESGLTGLPLSLTAFAVAAGSGRALSGARPGRVIGAGLALIGVGGILSLVLVHGDAGWTALIAGFAAIGLGVGLISPMLGSTTMSSVPMQRAGMAAGAVNTMRQLGLAFGVALLGTVYATRAASSLAADGVADATATAHALAGGQTRAILAAVPEAARPALDQALRDASIAGLQGAFAISGVCGLLAGLTVFGLLRTGRSPVAAQPVAEAAAASAVELRGRVHDVAGRDVVGAIAVVIDPNGVPAARGFAGPDGVYELAVPAPGRYLLVVLAPGHATHARIVSTGHGPASEAPASRAVLAPAGTNGLTGTVSAGGPVQHALVVLLNSSGELVAVARTGADGRYGLPAPPEGQHTLVAAAGAHGTVAHPLGAGVRHVDLALDVASV